MLGHQLVMASACVASTGQTSRCHQWFCIMSLSSIICFRDLPGQLCHLCMETVTGKQSLWRQLFQHPQAQGEVEGAKPADPLWSPVSEALNVGPESFLMLCIWNVLIQAHDLTPSCFLVEKVLGWCSGCSLRGSCLKGKVLTTMRDSPLVPSHRSFSFKISCGP